MTAAEPPEDWWQPDCNLVDHVRVCKVDITILSGPDRAWVVAGLTALGWTAEDTATQLQCSLRLIRQIRAEPMTIVATYALSLRDQVITADVHIANVERRCFNTTQGLRQEVTRMTKQRDKLLTTLKASRTSQPA